MGRKEGNPTHGKSKSKLYALWYRIKTRCYNKNAPQYNWYGARGIGMQGSWIHDFISFEKYVVSLDNYNKKNIGCQGLSIDRINNNGNYEEGNLRWSTKTIQQRNRGMFKNNKTGYTGVCHTKNKSKFKSSIRVNTKLIHLGVKETAAEAYQLRVDYILKHKLEGFEIKLP